MDNIMYGAAAIFGTLISGYFVVTRGLWTDWADLMVFGLLGTAFIVNVVRKR